MLSSLPWKLLLGEAQERAMSISMSANPKLIVEKIYLASIINKTFLLTRLPTILLQTPLWILNLISTNSPSHKLTYLVSSWWWMVDKIGHKIKNNKIIITIMNMGTPIHCNNKEQALSITKLTQKLRSTTTTINHKGHFNKLIHSKW